MTNAPENFESYMLPDGVERLEFTPDAKLANCGTFKIEREDHTLGNMLRMKLLENPDVIFVGYKQPHPLWHHILLRVQTTALNSPQKALSDCITELQSELGKIVSDLEKENPHGFERFSTQQGSR